MKKPMHWEEADAQLIKKLEKKHPHRSFRVLRGSMHSPYLQILGLGGWENTDEKKYL